MAAFPPRERTQWAAYVEGGRLPPASVLIGQEERRGLARALGLAIKEEPEHALVQAMAMLLDKDKGDARLERYTRLLYDQAVILEGCGHWTQQERADDVNALLLEFLSQLA